MMIFLYILMINVFHLPKVILVDESEEGCSEECNEPIYCNDDILHTVQLSEFVHNSQDFVDSRLKDSPKTIRRNFRKVKHEHDEERRNKELQKFLEDNFEREPNFSTFCEWNYFPEMPDVDNMISDEKYREFYRDINKEWKNFPVRIPDGYQHEPESSYHSIIYVPNCYMKKDESDSMPNLLQAYWILRGMLTNRMFYEVEAMLRNYAYLINKFNFIPYTNRVYAQDRAQYPLFALMVEDYTDRFKNPEFLQDMLPVLEKEFKWWLSKRKAEITKGNKVFMLFRYSQVSCKPRPEVYKHDYNLASNLEEKKAKTRFFSALRGLNACGIGFSRRFVRHKQYPNPLLNVKVSNTIPVELNSVLQRYAFLLGKWYTDEDSAKARRYSNRSKMIKKAMHEVLWNQSKNMWFDYDYDYNKPIEAFYATNLMPIFTFSHYDDKKIGEKAVKYLLEEKLIKENNYPQYLLLPITKYPGWLWDFPHGSLLLTAFVIEGLRETEDERAKEVAARMAQALIKVAHNGYDKYDNLLERHIILPNSEEAKNYNQKNKGKISAASLGCVTTMLRWYGQIASFDDYQSILTSDYYSSQELVFASPPTTMDSMNLDSESEEMPTGIEADDEAEDIEEGEEKAAKRPKTQQ